MNKPSDDPAGIGHNQGPPLNLSGSWVGYCWVRARREVWDNPPIEVVRRRLRRAGELGLSYRQYTGIQLDKGVRTEALVFDLSSLGRPAPRPMTLSAPHLYAPRAAFAPTPAPSIDEVIERMAGKIKALRNCKILAAAEEAGALLDELNRRAGNVIGDCAYYPNRDFETTSVRSSKRGSGSESSTSSCQSAKRRRISVSVKDSGWIMAWSCNGSISVIVGTPICGMLRRQAWHQFAACEV
jgi:hypothetical protein